LRPAHEVARHTTALGAATDQTAWAEAARQKQLAEQRVATLDADQQTALTRADGHGRQAATSTGRPSHSTSS